MFNVVLQLLCVNCFVNPKMSFHIICNELFHISPIFGCLTILSLVYINPGK